MTLTAQIAVLLIAAVVAVPLFRKLKLGAVLGYLAAGIVIGPAGFGIVTDVERILHFSEFGVVLLLFVIGLELQPSRLWVLRRTVFGVGSLQVVATTLVIGSIAWVLGQSWLAALLIGFALSLSSTALVLQLMAERDELKTHQGRTAFGILLMQDLAVMPVLALLPLLTRSSQQAINWSMFAVAMAVLAGVAFGGRYVLRPLLRIVADTQVQEAFTAASLLVVTGTAVLFDAVGLSMALGAFIAGMLLADSEYRHELDADIQPFKGLLLGLFFIAVGMTANIGLLSSEPLRVFGVTLGFMLLKAMVIWVIARLTAHKPATSRSLAVAMASGGEFAFVLCALGANGRLLDPEMADLIVLAVTLSMLLAPLLMAAHTRLESFPRAEGEEKPYDTILASEPRVLIAGFGRFGQVVGRVLRARRIPFTALEISQAQVDFLRRFGNKLYYGDASRLEILRAAGIEQAEALILAIDDVEASVRTVELVRRHYPKVRILARARNRQHAFRLLDLGVHYMIRETFVSSLELASATLEVLGSSTEEARQTVRRFRAFDERTLLEQQSVKDDESKLIAAARESAAQLEQLFEEDDRNRALPEPG